LRFLPTFEIFENPGSGFFTVFAEIRLIGDPKYVENMSKSDF